MGLTSAVATLTRSHFLQHFCVHVHCTKYERPFHCKQHQQPCTRW
jgi:hypothetical protein